MKTTSWLKSGGLAAKPTNRDAGDRTGAGEKQPRVYRSRQRPGWRRRETAPRLPEPPATGVATGLPLARNSPAFTGGTGDRAGDRATAGEEQPRVYRSRQRPGWRPGYRRRETAPRPPPVRPQDVLLVLADPVQADVYRSPRRPGCRRRETAPRLLEPPIQLTVRS